MCGVGLLINSSGVKVWDSKAEAMVDIYICVYLYIYIYYTRTHTHTHTRTHTHTHIHIQMSVQEKMTVISEMKKSVDDVIETG